MKDFRVLIVDDEPDFLETIVKRLKKRKIDASGVSSGKEALALLEAQVFDVVVLDVRMPGMDGIETLREMKRMRPVMEVIMLTGHASVESGMQGMQLGAFDYMMKPADIDELLEKIRQAYQRKSLHEDRLKEDKIIG
ncbi:MAG: sigma-54-dependent transcriptional regulator [Acidobacteriota bacterium]